MTTEEAQDMRELIVDSVNAALTKHVCLVGWTAEDIKGVSALKALLVEHTAQDFRDVFDIAASIKKTRNTIGNIVLTIVCGGVATYLLTKLFPSIFVKLP